MRWVLILMFLINWYSSYAQEHFVSFIDIDSSVQIGTQIYPVKTGEYMISVLYARKNNSDPGAGLLKVDIDGQILDSLLIKGFSDNTNSILRLDSTMVMYSGEYIGSDSFTVFIINKSPLIINDTIILKSDNIFLNKYYQLNSIKVLNKLIVGGNVFYNDNRKTSLLFVLNKDFEIINTIDFNPEPIDVSINSYQYFTIAGNDLIIYQTIFDHKLKSDSVQIIRLDTLFNKTFQWSLPVLARGHIPRGCVTSDDNMIITVPVGYSGNLEEIWSLDTDGTTNWIYEWPSDLGTTNVLRIEEAKNGDLFVMGQRWNPAVLDDKRNVAIVMRLDKDGHELWRRYFKLADQNTLLSNYVSDLVELDNGDLLLTGQTRRIIYDPSIGMERPDQDIFWARIGGDGCINGDCEEVYIVTSTEEVEIEKESWARIYPNPSTSHELNISLSKSAKVELMGISGKNISNDDVGKRS